MSSLIVEVCEILDVIPHQNADRLEKLIIKGWQVIAQKGFCKKGDKVIYFPPDSVMNHSLSEKLGITKYLSQVPTLPDEEPRYRVKAARLRGEPSFGTIMECEDPNWAIGTDVKDIYNITKHEPIVNLDGDAEQPHENFHHYTEIENIRNFPNILQKGEEIIYTEKIHGCLQKNSDITLINGSSKKINEIEIGDKIRSFDGKQYVEDIVKRVIIQDVHPDLEWLELEFDNRQKLRCTSDHLILTKNRGWITAQNLNNEDLII